MKSRRSNPRMTKKVKRVSDEIMQKMVDKSTIRIVAKGKKPTDAKNSKTNERKEE